MMTALSQSTFCEKTEEKHDRNLTPVYKFGTEKPVSYLCQECKRKIEA